MAGVRSPATSGPTSSVVCAAGVLSTSYLLGMRDSATRT
jgi:hypothetical protein